MQMCVNMNFLVLAHTREVQMVNVEINTTSSYSIKLCNLRSSWVIIFDIIDITKSIEEKFK